MRTVSSSAPALLASARSTTSTSGGCAEQRSRASESDAVTDGRWPSPASDWANPSSRATSVPTSITYVIVRRTPSRSFSRRRVRCAIHVSYLQPHLRCRIESSWHTREQHAADEPLDQLKGEVCDDWGDVHHTERRNDASKRTQHPLGGTERPAQPRCSGRAREPGGDHAHQKREPQKREAPAHDEKEKSRSAHRRGEHHLAYKSHEHVERGEQQRRDDDVGDERPPRRGRRMSARAQNLTFDAGESRIYRPAKKARGSAEGIDAA